MARRFEDAMALLSINDDALPGPAAIAAALSEIVPRGPVVVMIHGYKFNPSDPARDPHRHILSLTPKPGCRTAVSWPRHLGLTGARGLGIGFGWQAHGHVWAARRNAARAGAHLAELIVRIAAVAPDRKVHVFAHSLGARVAIAALPLLPAGAVGRIVLIAAALFHAEAATALASHAGRSAEVFNVTGRENLLFNSLLRAAFPLSGKTLGGGIGNRPNCLDLPLDRTATLTALAGLGYRIPPPKAPICHWSGYLRPGIWGLYRALLHDPAQLPLAQLRTQIVPPKVGAFARISSSPPLPFRPQVPF
jgi:pimeloyl-ACP methyl ester carboxylesterase